MDLVQKTLIFCHSRKPTDSFFHHTEVGTFHLLVEVTIGY